MKKVIKVFKLELKRISEGQELAATRANFQILQLPIRHLVLMHKKIRIRLLLTHQILTMWTLKTAQSYQEHPLLRSQLQFFRDFVFSMALTSNKFKSLSTPTEIGIKFSVPGKVLGLQEHFCSLATIADFW
jgi:hypothetical protein